MTATPMKINGLPVVDATKPVTIEITKGDVRKGATKDPAACAAALACMRKFHADAARVHLGRTYLKMGKKWVRFHTSDALRIEIVAFDRGGTFEPGRYTLGAIQPSRRKRVQQGSTNYKRGTGNKRTRPYHITTGVRVHGAAR